MVFSLQDQVRSLSNRILKLEQQMAADRSTILKLEQQMAAGRSTILLGELAYTVDLVAVKYVFGSDAGYFQTIKQLEVAYDAGELLGDEALRWQEFVAFMASKSWSTSRLVALTKPLRQLRKGVAHGEPLEKAGVTAAMLKDWAKEKLGQSASQRIADLVQLVSCFTMPGQPLVCVQDVRAVMQQQQQQQQ